MTARWKRVGSVGWPGIPPGGIDASIAAGPDATDTQSRSMPSSTEPPDSWRVVSFELHLGPLVSVGTVRDTPGLMRRQLQEFSA